MVANGHPFLDYGNSVPCARVGGFSRALQQLSNSRCPSIFVATHDSQAHSLVIYVTQTVLPHMDLKCGIFFIENIIGWLHLSKIFTCEIFSHEN